MRPLLISILALLLASCAPKVITERVVTHDTLTVERAVTQWRVDTLRLTMHDTTSVEVTRYDTLQRVTERVVWRNSKRAEQGQGSVIASRDTVYLRESSNNVTYTHSKPQPLWWMYPMCVLAVGVGMAIGYLFRKK